MYKRDGSLASGAEFSEPYGFCGRKATLNHASALVTVCR